MNAYIISLGVLSLVSVLGGLVNLLRLTRQRLEIEREIKHKLESVLDLKGKPKRTTDVNRRAA